MKLVRGEWDRKVMFLLEFVVFLWRIGRNTDDSRVQLFKIRFETSEGDRFFGKSARIVLRVEEQDRRGTEQIGARNPAISMGFQREFGSLVPGVRFCDYSAILSSLFACGIIWRSGCFNRNLRPPGSQYETGTCAAISQKLIDCQGVKQRRHRIGAAAMSAGEYGLVFLVTLCHHRREHRG